MEIGGGFGGKNDVYLEPLAALLSYHSGGRPVKMAMSHADVLAATGPAPASYIRARLGVDATGRITAAQAYLAYEAGAFPGTFIELGMTTIFGAYRIPNVQYDGYDVVVNKPRAAAYRAPGGPNALFAGESHGGRGLRTAGHGSAAIPAAERHPAGRPAAQRPALSVSRQPRDAAGGRRPPALLLPRWAVPTVGAVWPAPTGRTTAASPALRPPSTPTARSTCWKARSTWPAAAWRIGMQLAETLGIPWSTIATAVGDTASVGYTEGSYGSRTTFATGLAVHELGQKLLADSPSARGQPVGGRARPGQLRRWLLHATVSAPDIQGTGGPAG